jgi:hypothetical protein
MFSSIASKIGKYIGAMSPIELFNSNQLQKLKGEAHKLMTQNKPREMTSMFFDTMKTNIRDKMASYKKGGPGIAGFADYFSGYSLGDEMSKIAPGDLKFRSIARKTTGAALLGYMGSNMLFGRENPISNTIGFGANVGMHAGIGSLLGMVHPFVGVGYMGLSGINMLRSGNNLGPF